MPDTQTEMNLSGAVAEARVLQAPLAERLQHFAALLEHVAPGYARRYRGLIEQLVAVEAGKRAPKAGDSMPARYGASDIARRPGTIDARAWSRCTSTGGSPIGSS